MRPQEIAEIEETDGKHKGESAEAQFQLVGLQPFTDCRSTRLRSAVHQSHAAGDEHGEGRNREQKEACVLEKQAEQGGQQAKVLVAGLVGLKEPCVVKAKQRQQQNNNALAVDELEKCKSSRCVEQEENAEGQQSRRLFDFAAERSAVLAPITTIVKSSAALISIQTFT